MVKMIVTGGAGFIGSNFVNYMFETHPEYQIVNVDSLTYAGNLMNVARQDANPNYVFTKADITDLNAVEEVFRSGADLVVNFAAESHVDRSIMNPSIFVQTNIVGTQNLLEMAREYGVPRFIQVSTDEVYGTLGDQGYFTENTPLSPNSPYSSSKASADLIVRAYHETYGLSVNITRCSNNYGPYQFPEKLIPLMVINALENNKLPVYGDGLNVRDWLYVRDHCSAIDAVIHHGVSGEVYNIGGHNEKTNIEIVQTILKQLGKPDSLIQFVSDRPGHDRRYAIDAEKIRRQLGWKPQHNFESGIKKTIEWYLENQNWWENIRSGAYLTYYEEQYGRRLETTR